MKQTSLREQFIQCMERKKAEKLQSAEKTLKETVEAAPVKTEVVPEPLKEEGKPVRRRRKKILDDDDD